MQKCPKCGVGLVIKLDEDKPRNPSDGDHLDLKALLDRIDEDELDGNAREFVSQTRERFEQYGTRTRMSEKQMEWLRSIADGGNRKDDWN